MSTKAERKARDAGIVKAFEINFWRVVEIANLYQLSATRVRQILRANGCSV